MRRMGLVVLGLLLVVPALRAEDETPEAPQPVSYYRQVRPILQRNCSGCHQPAKAGGKLSLTAYPELQKGGDSGEGIVPGKPDESVLVEFITGDKPQMPLKAPPLPKDQVALISRWIAEGAKDDTPMGLNDTFSADNPPVYHSPPLISALAFSPDNQTLAVSGFHEVLLFKADGSEALGRLVGRSQRITSLVYSPDGSLLAATGGNPALFGEVQFWKTADKTLARSATYTADTLFGGRFNPDGSLFSFGGADNSARIIKVADGELALKFDAHADWVMDTTFSNDGKHLITVSRDRSMKLTVVETGQFIDNITSITPGALKGGLLTLRRRPGKDELLIGGSDGEPKLYKMIRTTARVIGDDANRLRSYAPVVNARIFALDFNGDGSRLAVGWSLGSSGMVRIFNTDDAAQIHEFKHPLPVFAVAFSPDGQRLATGGFDGKVRIFDVASGQLAKEFVPVTVTPTVAGN